MSRPAKRQKNSSIGEQMLCPISHELPVDPVTAEDGHVYERESIEGYYKEQEGVNVGGSNRIKSPVTRQFMGKRLFAAPQTRNTIEQLIEERVIKGNLAKSWKDKVAEKKKKDELIKKAEDGNVDGIMKLAYNYYHGTDGFKEDLEMAYFWFKRAQVAGNVEAKAMIGGMLVTGSGVEKDHVQGYAFLGMASADSNLAAYYLGIAFAEGRSGISVDKVEACRLLKLVAEGKCAHNHLSDDCVEKACKRLEELENE